jgi:hypothetical protein
MKILTAALMVAMFAVPALAYNGPALVGDIQTPSWAPGDPAWALVLQGNGVWEIASDMAPGTYLYKAVEDSSWTHAFPGNNQTFTIPAARDIVTWYVNLGATVGTKEGDEYLFHSLNPPIVCGDFMSELGGSDWDQTDTSTTVMTGGEVDGIWEFSAAISPAGSYSCKVVLNNNWDQDTKPPSSNYAFGSDGVTPVTFKYHMATNTTEIISAAPPSVLYGSVLADCPQDPSKVEIKFSEVMDQTTAETTTNYVFVDPIGTTVTSAVQDAGDGSVVVLTVSPALAAGDDVNLTVSGVLAADDSQPVDPSNNDACFYVQEVVFELNMELYVDANGLPTSVHIQGDGFPLTWGVCEGCELFDDGLGDDATAGDTTYTVTQYFSIDNCDAPADTFQLKYKYITDCTTWETGYDFGHYLDINPALVGQLHNVWWDDVSPVDNIGCDVGVRFQVANAPACGQALYVRGTELPLDWSVGTELVDDGTGGDLASGDGIYSALVTFPTGTYKFLGYKYFCAESDTSGVYECDGLPDRALTLDDVNGCMAFRAGPMEFVDLWNWCEPVTSTPEGRQTDTTWGVIKSMYAPKK